MEPGKSRQKNKPLSREPTTAAPARLDYNPQRAQLSTSHRSVTEHIADRQGVVPYHNPDAIDPSQMPGYDKLVDQLRKKYDLVK